MKKKVCARRSVPALIHAVALLHQYNRLTGHDKKHCCCSHWCDMFYLFFSWPINAKSVLLCLYLEFIANIMFVCVFENRVHLVPRISALWITPNASLWLILRVWTAGGWSSMTAVIQTSLSEFVTLSALITVMTEASLKSSTWQPFIISKKIIKNQRSY